MPKRLLVFSRTQPARMILGIVALGTFLVGIWILLPWYLPLSLPAASKALGVTVMIAGCINACVSVPALYAAFWKNCPKAIARGAFWLFLWYMFVALTRMIFAGSALGWVTVLIIALIMAVVYVEQRYVAATTAVHERTD